MIIKNGYLARVTSSTNAGRLNKNQTYRNWWIIKYKSPRQSYVPLTSLTLPANMAGKKIRFKIEIIKE